MSSKNGQSSVVVFCRLLFLKYQILVCCTSKQFLNLILSKLLHENYEKSIYPTYHRVRTKKSLEISKYPLVLQTNTLGHLDIHAFAPHLCVMCYGV